MTVDVEKLPRRVAHAVHALMDVRNDRTVGPYGPYKAREVMLYDPEALSPTSTGAALREARKLGLASYWGSGLWSASFLALELQTAFEERFLRETSDLRPLGDSDGR